MTANEIADIIREHLVAEVIPPEDAPNLNDTTPLQFDSLTMLMLVGFFEKRFNVLIQPYEIDPARFEDIAKMSGFLQNKMSHQ